MLRTEFSFTEQLPQRFSSSDACCPVSSRSWPSIAPGRKLNVPIVVKAMDESGDLPRQMKGVVSRVGVPCRIGEVNPDAQRGVGAPCDIEIQN